MEKKFSDLKFVRINNQGTSPEIIDMVFRQIPKKLFEQVKDVEFNIDLLYQAPSRFISNANTMFYVLTNDTDIIKGILWAYVNILTEKIQVNILSIDKEYQFSDAIEKTLEFIRSWQGENENLKIQIVTIRTKAYEEAGFEKSKHILMEI
ncbi:hypothetical protein LCGC14_1638480 [marine sediment metagenome]|uniref:N-acetyltransferase domain-containing protein n=1 Tax=marine sediment metagenome TaxID=412755 RepID=A0A0F9IMW2_9ZZZZ